MRKMKIHYKEIIDTYKTNKWKAEFVKKYGNLFPVYPNPRLAGIVADLMGDGHLQGVPKWRIDYTSKYIAELERFGNEFYVPFRIRGKYRPCTGNKFGKTYTYSVNNKPFAKLFYLLGVPTGAKVLQPFLIPSWIIKDRKNFGRFVNRLFSCEATVDLQNKYVELQMYKAEMYLSNGISFFNQVKKSLDKHFDIKTTNPFLEKRRNKRKDGIITRAIRMKIKRRDALIKYYNFIGFDDRQKQEKLKRIVDNWKD